MTDRITKFKAWVKSGLGWLVFHLGVHRLLTDGRAIIVLFHRVDDRYSGTPISSTRPEFAAFLRFFKRFYTVISLGELLARLRRGEDVGNCLVITFDDGYLDNYRDAAPLLASYGLPACFFVVTDFMGSDSLPWWDEELGIQAEWMNWDQVRALQAQGFEIGAHTMNHVDLGVTLGDDAFAEILGSKRRLEHELGAPVDYFSYPYGRRHQLAEENREAVQRAGFACCLSAFGGAVAPGDDPFRLHRTAVSPWFKSPYQFGFETAFRRT
ncbi:MAG: polysaccharide deacetylase family protein [Gemmatimonadaceae bacterium]